YVSHLEPPVTAFYSCTSAVLPAIVTLSLHDALPISGCGGYRQKNWSTIWSKSSSESRPRAFRWCWPAWKRRRTLAHSTLERSVRSEEHTSELQSPDHIVCRLLLEKKTQEVKRKTTE